MTDKGYWVWGVVYSNYEPKEVNGLYATKELAQISCDRGNEHARETFPGTDQWEVAQMFVNTT